MAQRQTIVVEYFESDHKPILSCLVLLHSREPILKQPEQRIAMLFGNQLFSLSHQATLDLRDFCNAVLAKKKSKDKQE